MAWVIRKAGVTKTFTTTWLTTWLTSYTTNWVTSWNSTYTTYTYQNTTTYWTSVVAEYIGEGIIQTGNNLESRNTTTTYQYFVRNSERCAAEGSCNQSYDAQLGGWYSDNCPPIGPCGYTRFSTPNILGNGVIYYITYYSPQPVAINANTSPTTSTSWYEPVYGPGPVYRYDYYSTSGSTSTVVASSNTEGSYSQNTSRNTSNNTSQNTSRITF